MASNPDVDNLDGTQDLNIPVQQSTDNNSINHPDVWKFPDDTISLSDIQEFLGEHTIPPALKQGLSSVDYNVPASFQMASSHLSPAVQHNVNSAPLASPTSGEGNIGYKATSGQTLPSINEFFNFDRQTASALGDYSISSAMTSSDSSSVLHNSATSTPAPLGNTKYSYAMNPINPSLAHYISATSASTPPGYADISYLMTSNDSSSVFHNSTAPTPATLGDANISYAMTSINPSLDHYVSGTSTSAPPEDASIRYEMTPRASNHSPGFHISIPPIQAPPRNAEVNYQITSSQPHQYLCNMVNSVTSTSPSQGSHQLSSKQSAAASYNSASLGYVNNNHQMPLKQLSPALCNVQYIAPPASPLSGCADINHQMPIMQPSPAPCNVATPESRCAANNQRMSFRQLSPALCNVQYVAPPASPLIGCADINHQMPIMQPSPTFCNVATPVSRRSGINQRMPFRQLSPAPCNVQYVAPPASPEPGCADINHQMPFMQPAPCNITPPVSLAPGCVDMTQRMALRPPFSAPYNSALPTSLAHRGGNFNHRMPFRQPSSVLSNFAPPALPAAGCDNSSPQLNTSDRPLALNHFMLYARQTAPKPRRGVRISKPAVKVLEKWFDFHSDHPYPDEKAVDMLSSICNLTAAQVKKWCSNKRMRSKQKPETQTLTVPTTNDNEYSFADLRNACE